MTLCDMMPQNYAFLCYHCKCMTVISSQYVYDRDKRGDAPRGFGAGRGVYAGGVGRARCISGGGCGRGRKRLQPSRRGGAHDAVMDAFHAHMVLHFFLNFLQSAEFAFFGCLDYSHSGVGGLVIGVCVVTLSPTTPWPLWFIILPKSAGGSRRASPARGILAWCRRRRRTRHCPRRDRRRRDGARCRAGV